MPWQSGQYFLFSKLLILYAAPAESGVFGLYSSQEKIFMGESDNIRRTLLRFDADIERFGFEPPMGFTYELCPEELRVKRLRTLVAESGLSSYGVRPNIIMYG